MKIRSAQNVNKHEVKMAEHYYYYYVLFDFSGPWKQWPEMA